MRQDSKSLRRDTDPKSSMGNNRHKVKLKGTRVTRSQSQGKWGEMVVCFKKWREVEHFLSELENHSRSEFFLSPR